MSAENSRINTRMSQTHPPAPLLEVVPAAILENPRHELSHQDVQVVMLNLEKSIVHRVMKRLFGEDASETAFSKLYSDSVTSPRFLPESEKRAWPMLLEAAFAAAIDPERITIDHPYPMVSSQSQQQNDTTSPQSTSQVWCQLYVRDLSASYVVKESIPPFAVELRQLDGSEIPRANEGKPLADVRVKLTLFNKWADVTSEILPNTDPYRTLVDGKCVIDDLWFLEVSAKHGGFFILQISSIDNQNEIASWRSAAISILSHNTIHSKRKKMKGNEDGASE
eukprot:c2241_g1_i1.p1 GENE.c2241_g1_i1~~c2241_g1_i1.p1  ORF type:complete len:280 (-),score=77.54 c2241_g1_i1:75-914(-)